MPGRSSQTREAREITFKEGFYSVADFLRIYSMGRTSLYRPVNAGQIRITKTGRSSRIAKTDAKAWADRLPTTGGEV